MLRFLRSGTLLPEAAGLLLVYCTVFTDDCRCRLESDVIVLRGGENEASSQMLRGVVVLCLPSSLKVDDVHLRMTGQSKIGYVEQFCTSQLHDKLTQRSQMG